MDPLSTWVTAAGLLGTCMGAAAAAFTVRYKERKPQREGKKVMSAINALAKEVRESHQSSEASRQALLAQVEQLRQSFSASQELNREVLNRMNEQNAETNQMFLGLIEKLAEV